MPEKDCQDCTHRHVCAFYAELLALIRKMNDRGVHVREYFRVTRGLAMACPKFDWTVE